MKILLRKLFAHKLLILFLSAFLIRLIGLNQSLWLDEAISVNVVRELSLWDMLWYFTPFDFHPPFFYFFLMAWIKVFGISEIAIRMPSVIFSLLAGLSIYNIGKKLKNEQVGFWAGAFFLFNPLIVYYSQEARMYMMVLYFIIRSFELLLRVENPKERTLFDIVSLNVFLFLAFFTFYGSIFYIVSVYLYLLLKKQYKTFFLILPGFVLSLLTLAQILSQQLIGAQAMLVQVKNWSLVLGNVTVKNLLLIPIKFTSGRISFHPKIMYYLIAAVWTAVVFFFAFRGMLMRKKLAYFLLFPLIVGTVVSVVTPMLQYFRFLYLIPFLALLLALAVTQDRNIVPKKLRYYYPYSKGILLTGFVVFSLVYTLIPAFHREDWRSFERLLKLTTTENTEVYIVQSAADPLRYYNYGRTMRRLDSLKQRPPMNNKIVIIPYVADIHGIDYKKDLESLKFRKYKDHVVRELTFEEWVRY